MTETEPDKPHELVEALTPDEIKVLRKVLYRVEWQLFQAVVERLKIAVLVVAGFFTMFGLASFVTIRSAVVEAVADRLVDDSDLREQIVAESSVNLQRFHGILKQSERLEKMLVEEEERVTKRMKEEETRATVILNADLRKLLDMVGQISTEMTRVRRGGQ